MEALGLPVRERFERAAWLLKAVGLGERLDFKPSRLSGGQRQRVAIARALANGPRIILADEPTGELHTEDKAQVIALFRQLNSEGCAVVMVTHDQEVAQVARRRIEIRDGTVTEVGAESPTLPPAEVGPRGVSSDGPTGTAPWPGGCSRRRSRPARAGPGRAGSRSASWRWRRWRGAARPTASGCCPGLGGATAAPTPSVAEAPAYPTARGEVRPVAQAKVGTLRGGVVNRLAVSVGQPVDEAQEIARINGPDGSTELLVSPWRGTITDIPVHVGDTVALGAVVASVGDLSRLQVETTDVDEFIVGRVAPGNMVLVTVDALDQRQLRGRVRSVSLEPRRRPGRRRSLSDDHRPGAAAAGDADRHGRAGGICPSRASSATETTQATPASSSAATPSNPPTIALSATSDAPSSVARHRRLPLRLGRGSLGDPHQHPRQRPQAGSESVRRLPHRHRLLTSSGCPYPDRTRTWVVTME